MDVTMWLPVAICVLSLLLWHGSVSAQDKDVKHNSVSPSRLVVPNFAYAIPESPPHVFNYIGQEFVDKRFEVSWMHLIQSALLPKAEVAMETDFALTFNYTIVCTNRERMFRIAVSTTDTDVLDVRQKRTNLVSCKNASASYYRYNPFPSAMPTTLVSSHTQSHIQRLQADFFYYDGQADLQLSSGNIGKTFIEFVLEDITNSSHTVGASAEMTTHPSGDAFAGESHREVVRYPVSVLRNVRPVDKLFRVIVYCMQVFVMIGFGIKLDVQIVKEHLWKPVAPAIGLCCQYILMPLIAFGVAKVITLDSEIVALGIFIAGCCPGGGASNMYSYLLNGNLSLSITMTAISTVAALAMLPLWVYTLGYTFLKDQDLKIPFSMVAVSLSILITPLVVGIFLRQKLPKVAKTINKILKPVILIMTLLLLVLGVYTNLYIFRMFRPRTVLAACLLPYIGYIAGGVISLVGQRDWSTVKTIAIETGMQNTSIAYILMTSSFPAPEGDLGSIAPIASAVMTPIPLFLITLVYVAYGKLRKKYASVEQTEDTAKDGFNMDGVHELDENNKA